MAGEWRIRAAKGAFNFRRKPSPTPTAPPLPEAGKPRGNARGRNHVQLPMISYMWLACGGFARRKVRSIFAANPLRQPTAATSPGGRGLRGVYGKEKVAPAAAGERARVPRSTGRHPEERQPRGKRTPGASKQSLEASAERRSRAADVVRLRRTPGGFSLGGNLSARDRADGLGMRLWIRARRIPGETARGQTAADLPCGEKKMAQGGGGIPGVRFVIDRTERTRYNKNQINCRRMRRTAVYGTEGKG